MWNRPYEMLFREENNNLYSHLATLEEKLNKSEAERKALEIKFQYLTDAVKNEEEERIKDVRRKYVSFLEDCKHRNERNEMMLRSLQKLENGATAVFAKTERLKQLRTHYDAYLSRVIPRWRQPGAINETVLQMFREVTPSIGAPPSAVSTVSRHGAPAPIYIPIEPGPWGLGPPKKAQIVAIPSSLGQAGLRMVNELEKVNERSTLQPPILPEKEEVTMSRPIIYYDPYTMQLPNSHTVLPSASKAHSERSFCATETLNSDIETLKVKQDDDVFLPNDKLQTSMESKKYSWEPRSVAATKILNRTVHDLKQYVSDPRYSMSGPKYEVPQPRDSMEIECLADGYGNDEEQNLSDDEVLNSALYKTPEKDYPSWSAKSPNDQSTPIQKSSERRTADSSGRYTRDHSTPPDSVERMGKIEPNSRYIRDSYKSPQNISDVLNQSDESSNRYARDSYRPPENNNVKKKNIEHSNPKDSYRTEHSDGRNEKIESNRRYTKDTYGPPDNMSEYSSPVYPSHPGTNERRSQVITDISSANTGPFVKSPAKTFNQAERAIEVPQVLENVAKSPSRTNNMYQPENPLARNVVLAHQKSVDELKNMLSFEEDEPPTYNEPPQQQHGSQPAMQTDYFGEEDVPEEFTEQTWKEPHYDARFQNDVSRNVILEEEEPEEHEEVRPIEQQHGRRDWRKLQFYREQGKLIPSDFRKKPAVVEPVENERRQSPPQQLGRRTPESPSASRSRHPSSSSPLLEASRRSTPVHMNPDLQEDQRSLRGSHGDVRKSSENVSEERPRSRNDRVPPGQNLDEPYQHPNDIPFEVQRSPQQQDGGRIILKEGESLASGNYDESVYYPNQPEYEQPAHYDANGSGRPNYTGIDNNVNQMDNNPSISGEQQYDARHEQHYAQYDPNQEHGGEQVYTEQNPEQPYEYVQQQYDTSQYENQYEAPVGDERYHQQYQGDPNQEGYNEQYGGQYENDPAYVQNYEQQYEGHPPVDGYPPYEAPGPSDYVQQYEENPGQVYEGERYSQQQAEGLEQQLYNQELPQNQQYQQQEGTLSPSNMKPEVVSPPKAAESVKPSILSQLMESDSESYHVEQTGAVQDDSDFDFSIGKQ